MLITLVICSVLNNNWPTGPTVGKGVFGRLQCDDAFCLLCFSACSCRISMSNWLASYNLGQWFMISGYRITKMKKWKRMCGGNFTMVWYLGHYKSLHWYSCRLLVFAFVGINTELMMLEPWSNRKYDSFIVDSRPRSVIRNMFYISYPFIKQDLQIYPNALNGIHSLKTRN